MSEFFFKFIFFNVGKLLNYWYFVCQQLIGQSCVGNMSLVEMLVNNLLGRMVDSDLTVRMLCIRGLGNISAAGPAQVSC